VVYCVRADARRSWPSWLALGLLVGLAAGAVMAAAAGARRTESAYQDLRRETAALDAVVFFLCEDPTEDCPTEAEAVRDLPGVDDAAFLLTPQLPVTDAAGDLVQVQDDPCYSGSGGLQPLVPLGPGFGTTIQRLRIVEGRAADPDRIDEAVLAPEVAASEGVEVGDRLFVNLPADCQDDRADWPEPLEVTVVGLGFTSVEVPPKNGFYLQGLHLSPDVLPLLPATTSDLADETGAGLSAGAGVALRLDAGVTLDDLAADPAWPEFGIIVEPAFIAEPIDAGLQTDANALWIVALAGGVVALAVLIPTLARSQGDLATDDQALAALGWHRRDRALRAAAHGVVIGGIAAMTSVVVMALASLSTPIGDARAIEPHPGMEVDLVVFGLGAVVLLTFVTVLLAVLARRPVTPSAVPRKTPLAGLAARLGLSPIGTIGIRVGLEPARRQAPVRTAILGVALAVTAVVGVLAYTSSAQHLRETPAWIGVVWDDLVYVAEAEDGVGAAAAATTWPEVERAGSALLFTPALGLGPDGEFARVFALSSGADAVEPTVIDGRGPAADDEILLSPLLAEDLDLAVGDRVESFLEVEIWSEEGPEYIRTEPFDLEVVGTGPVPVGDGGFDTGSLMTTEGLVSHYPPEALEDDPSPARRADFVAIDRAPGVTDAEIVARFDEIGIGYDVDEFDFDVLLNNIVAIDRTSTESAPDLLALFMAVLAVLVLVYGVTVSMGRNGRDLAVARALGVTPRQLRRTGLWAGGSFATAALVIAIPVGVVVGRVVWRTYATGLGVVPYPVVRPLEPVVVVLVTLLLAATTGAVAARRQARRTAATVLRSE